ncbi:MAG TPA: NmrA family NAD(P)-binding protein [Candidatus Eisenbacteria bacterium]|jgi:uncharacterized protein YbjT (DUF2867 family)|nr:NmrA family NAD(P)-binding protein [Candidatus Eisenbacteria bacterium]
MYVVLGASGNTGTAVARKLLSKGEKVRAVGRDALKLSALARLGADVDQADLNDSAALANTFTGAKGAYLLIPPQIQAPDFIAAADAISTSIADAVKDSGVAHVVVLSSIGAQHAERTGPIVALHRLEEKLKQVPQLSALFLRPAYFMENFMMMIPLVQAMGFFAGGIRGDLKMPMIATRDIGDYAADRLAELDFTGFSTHEMLGQRDVSHDEAAAAIGAAIGKPKLSYQKFPAFLVEQGIKQLGVPKKTASLMTEMHEAGNEGLLIPQEPRSEQNTTPTSIEVFAEEEFAPLYQAKAATA